MSADGAAPADGIWRCTLGQGPRHMLALHCTLAHSGAWRPLSQALEGRARFSAMDMPSHGRSPDWDGRGDFQTVVTGAARPMLEPGMDVIGHSFGATVALRLAAEAPDLVRSLTLIEPVFFAIAMEDAPETVAEHDRIAAPFMAALERGEAETGARLFNRMWGAGASWDDLPASARAAMTRAVPVVPTTVPALVEDCHGLSGPGVLERVRCPTLLLRGSETLPVIAAVQAGLARRLPDAREAVVPGAGHMLPLTQPAETAHEVAALLARS